MSITRRAALRTLAAGATTAVLPRRVWGEGARQPEPGAVGILYDPTRCIGCKECIRACAAENGGDAGQATADDAQLSTVALAVLTRYEVGGTESFRKSQCMHCVDPGCVAACPLGAMHKDADGAVVWNSDLCIGCRYCEIACPHAIPRFQWDTPTPVLRKCEMCKARRARGLEPACTAACRMGALVYGQRAELLREAHRRIDADPGSYNPKVYGEHDAGGSAVLYLAKAGVSFASVGLPELGTKSVPATPEKVQHAIYKGFALPLALYGTLALVVRRNARLEHPEHEVEHAAPVGGRLLTWPFGVLLFLAVIGLATIVWRFAVGLGATTNLSDGYPFGLWITFDVVTGTALACGGYAVALLVYALNRGAYHPLVRAAIVTSALGYTLGGTSVLIDIGRPWNFYKIPMLFWHWNFSSILLEVALCIMVYTMVLWIELSPAFLERWAQSEVRGLRRFARKVMPKLERAMPYLIALGMLLPTMHQSSLGGLMMLSGHKLNPLWQTPLLPLLFLISCVAMGYGAVTLECCFSSRMFRRPKETEMLRALSGPVALVLATYLVVRLLDVYSRGVLPLVTRLDGPSLLFLGEMALFALPMLALLFARRKATDAYYAFIALTVIGAGALYRFSTYLIAYDPGARWSYFPAAPEFAVTIGLVALELIGYIVIVKRFPVLRGVRPPVPAAEPEERPDVGQRRHRTGAAAASIAGLGLLLLVGPLRAQNYGHFDGRCLTDRPDQCLARPLPKNEPHKAVCATCHNLWDNSSPKAAAQSCTRGGCHEHPASLTVFHSKVEPRVLANCIRCHPAHDARVTVGHGGDCLYCHPAGGKRPPVHRASTLR